MIQKFIIGLIQCFRRRFVYFHDLMTENKICTAFNTIPEDSLEQSKLSVPAIPRASWQHRYSVVAVNICTKMFWPANVPVGFNCVWLYHNKFICFAFLQKLCHNFKRKIRPQRLGCAQRLSYFSDLVYKLHLTSEQYKHWQSKRFIDFNKY